MFSDSPFLVEAALTSLLLTICVENGSSFETLIKMEGQLWNSPALKNISEGDEITKQ